MSAVDDWKRTQAELRRAARGPFAVQRRAELVARMDAAHKAAWSDWPLSEDELARRAALDARPVDTSWQAGAVDPDCPACGELPGFACPGHLGAWQDARSRRLTDCGRCGGEGRELVEGDNGSMSWRACPWCNRRPPLPPMIPGGLAVTAWSVPRMRGPRYSADQKLAMDARAVRYWASDEAKAARAAPPMPQPGAGARFGLPGLHCGHCGHFEEMPPGSWGDWQGPHPEMSCAECGCLPLGVIWPAD